jgi:integrase/recombinase XerD
MTLARHPDTQVQFTVMRQGGQITDIVTDSLQVNHFLRLIRATRARHTWISYAHDLKVFFAVAGKPPEAVTRQDCLAFVEQQDRAGRADATINRRLAAVSVLFGELHLLDPDRFPGNPVQPATRLSGRRGRRHSLYRRQRQRVPDIVADEHLRAFFASLRTWRDRALVLLMWVSCLRIGEAVAIRFGDIECSRRSIAIPAGKGGAPRTVYMDATTFAALNRYLDTERRDLAPEVDAVFVALKGPARGRPLTVNALQRLIRYHAHRCGRAGLHAHRFRHTGITQLVQQGMAEPAVRKLVGHKRPESLLPYLHLADGYVEAEFRRAQAGLDPQQLLDAMERGGVS